MFQKTRNFITMIALSSRLVGYAGASRGNQVLYSTCRKPWKTERWKNLCWRGALLCDSTRTVSICRIYEGFFSPPWFPIITDEHCEWTWHKPVTTWFIAFTGVCESKMFKGRQVSSTNEMMASVGQNDPLHSNVPATKIEVTVSCRLVFTSFELRMNRLH